MESVPKVWCGTVSVVNQLLCHKWDDLDKTRLIMRLGVKADLQGEGGYRENETIGTQSETACVEHDILRSALAHAATLKLPVVMSSGIKAASWRGTV
jgi:hypothetical protein